MSARFAAIVLLALFCVRPTHAGVGLGSFGIEPVIPGTTVFSSIGATQSPNPGDGANAVAAWLVTVDLALLRTLPSTLSVNLPDNTTVVLTKRRSAQRSTGYYWTGHASGCSALFSVSNQRVTATIACLRGSYGIEQQTAGNNARLVRYEVADESNYEPEYPPSQLLDASVIQGPKSGPDQTIDILVLFTGSFTNINIWAKAQYFVDQLQLALDNSTNPGDTSSIAEVRLAGASRTPRMALSEPEDDLTWAVGPEGVAMRDYWAADVIVFMSRNDTPDGAVLGTSHVPGTLGEPQPGPAFANRAAAAVLINHSIETGEYVAAHEFAHTIGANHNPDHDPANPTPLRPWAFGHYGRDPESPYYGNRTIMTYVDECGGLPCDRILNYSNPNVTEVWFKTGVENNRDNARLIKEYAPIAAQYRANIGRIFADGFQ